MIGSIRAARSAGARLAVSATMTSTSGIPTNVEDILNLVEIGE